MGISSYCGINRPLSAPLKASFVQVFSCVEGCGMTRKTTREHWITAQSSQIVWPPAIYPYSWPDSMSSLRDSLLASICLLICLPANPSASLKKPPNSALLV